MESQSNDIADRVRRFFGQEPGDDVDADRAAEMKKVAWWMVESEAAKKSHRGVRRFAQVLGAALPEAESPIEVLLGIALAKRHELAARFVPQLQVGPYRLDFGFRDVKLGVECDGADFHREPSQVLKDQRRDRFLSGLGWRIVRFTGWEIRRSAEQCAARVARYHEVLKAL